MTIPNAPADNSGGYMITTYTNGTDTHRSRLHVRAFDGTGTYTTPGAGTPTTVMADWTGVTTKLATLFNSAWSFNLTAIFKNNGDGTFTEVFGWAAPAQILGSGATATPADQTRAIEFIMNFRDGFGGRGRICLLGTGNSAPMQAPSTVGGASGGTIIQQIVDQITNPAKTNVVAHSGHQMQSPAHVTVAINKRLRRHYGFS